LIVIAKYEEKEKKKERQEVLRAGKGHGSFAACLAPVVEGEAVKNKEKTVDAWLIGADGCPVPIRA